MLADVTTIGRRGFVSVAGALGASLVGCAGVAAPPSARPCAPRPPQPSRRASLLTAAAEYRAAASAFEIVDNVAKWSSSKADPPYREEWTRRFGLDDGLLARFARYKRARMRVHPIDRGAADAATAPSGLFAPRKEPDLFAGAFYGSRTIDEALSQLAALLGAEDLASVEDTFRACRSGLEALLAEDAPLAGFAEHMTRELARPEVDDFTADLARFYGLTEASHFTALFVHWPAVDEIAANQRDDFLLMKYAPSTHRRDALRDVDVVVHELVHHASSRQPEPRKRELTRAFLAGGCAAPFSPKTLEEPLAVAQQKLFLSRFAKERFEMASRWYGSAYVSDVAKRLFPHVREAYAAGRRLDEALMRDAAESCNAVAAPGAAAPQRT